jgi:hypothetical protein
VFNLFKQNLQVSKPKILETIVDILTRSPHKYPIEIFHSQFFQWLTHQDGHFPQGPQKKILPPGDGAAWQKLSKTPQEPIGKLQMFVQKKCWKTSTESNVVGIHSGNLT